MASPKSAPGNADSDMEDERREAQQQVDTLREAERVARPDQVTTARLRLREALLRQAAIEQKIKAAQADVLNYPLPDYLKDAYGTGAVMLAITGGSGVGKSSLVNVLRRVKPTDPGAAPTGVNETTQEPTMYTFHADSGLFLGKFFRPLEGGRRQSQALIPQDQQAQSNGDGESFQLGDRVLLQDVPEVPEDESVEVVKAVAEGVWEVKRDSGRRMSVSRRQVAAVQAKSVVWDLPGVGTRNQPQATYLQRMGIRYFDVVVLVTCTRFTEAELALKDELKRFGVPFFLVRSKVDIDVAAEIENEEEMEGGELDDARRQDVEDQTIRCIKEYFRQDYGLDRVYCISTRPKLREKFDLRQLKADIEIGITQQRSAVPAARSLEDTTALPARASAEAVVAGQ